MNKRLAFLIDTRYCNNCKTCEIACKMERKLPTGQRWREVRRLEVTEQSGDHNAYTVYNIPMSCNHCEEPACVQICPQNAYRKMPEGPVVQIQSLCIGCTKCVSACPYSAPVYNPDVFITGKCDMCYDRLKADMLPYCVQCCPNNALKVDTYENLVARYGAHQELDVENTLVPSGGDTNPSVVIVTMKNQKQP